MTRETLISRERHQKSPIYGHVTELFFRIAIPTQRTETNEKKCEFWAVISAVTDSEHKISSNTTQTRTKQNLVSIFIVRTGTYL